MNRNYYRRVPESFDAQVEMTSAKGKPKNWTYNPINADVHVISENAKMPSIVEEVGSPVASRESKKWLGISSSDPPTQISNSNNSATQTDNIITQSDEEIEETDL